MRSSQVIFFLVLIAEIWCEVYSSDNHRVKNQHFQGARFESGSDEVGSRNNFDRANSLNPSEESKEEGVRKWHARSNSQNSIDRFPQRVIEEDPDILYLTQSSLANISPNLVSSYFHRLSNASPVRTISNRKFSPAHRDLYIDLIDISGNRSVSIDSFDKLITSPEFKNNKNVTIFVTGWSAWNAHGDGNAIDILANAYKCRNNQNFLVVDVGRFVNTFEDSLRLDTGVVGNWIGESIAKRGSVVPAHQYHLIGHGAGAHVVGAAARRYYDLTGSKIHRVTGLDPSRRWVNKIDESDGLGLSKEDAEFVDVIHTNNDILGDSNAVGDADFYPNGVTSIQPGYADVVGSHYSAVDYYAETVKPGLEDSYLAVALKGSSIEKVHMGYHVSVAAKGTYFLETNAEAPHGKNVNYNYKVKCNRY